MRWANNTIWLSGATNRGRAFYGRLTCGHVRVVDCPFGFPVPEDVICPVCDDLRVVPDGFVWDDVSGKLCPITDYPRLRSRNPAA